MADVTPRCPVCHTPVNHGKAAELPFCSDRCRLVDLGRWLGESYGLPRPDSPAAPDGEGDEES